MRLFSFMIFFSCLFISFLTTVASWLRLGLVTGRSQARLAIPWTTVHLIPVHIKYGVSHKFSLWFGLEV